MEHLISVISETALGFHGPLTHYGSLQRCSQTCERNVGKHKVHADDKRPRTALGWRGRRCAWRRGDGGREHGGGGGGEKSAVKVGSVLSECDMSEVRFGQRMFGDCEVAKWEGTGRTERRSAADLSTQTAALPLSARPQADKELCAYTK